MHEKGQLTGPMAELVKPMKSLLAYIKQFKKLSPGEKIAFMAQVPDEHHEKLQEILDTDSAEKMKEQLE